jgi:hypothetical protein
LKYLLNRGLHLVGSDQLALCSLSKGNYSEDHIVEEDSISEANLLFKCRMEEVLVQSISESGIGQPLTVKLEDELSGTLSADSGMPAIEASSVDELNSRISQVTKETLKCAASDHTCGNESVQDRSNGALPTENGHSSQSPADDGNNSDSSLDEPTIVKFEGKPSDMLTDCGELPILQASSVEESFKNIEEEVQKQIYPSSVHTFGQEGETCSDMVVLEAESIEDITSALGQLGHGHDIKLSDNGEVNSYQANINSGLHVIEPKSINSGLHGSPE